ncbi:MAG: hypothetical protein K5924_05195 [Chloroflexi bacterium]|nr:hypothetical protein [Chloroflexota bacterium]
MRGWSVGLIAIFAVIVAGGCAIGGPSVSSPTGPIELLPGAPEPDGEISVPVTGSTSDTGWRMLIWRSGDLRCRQLDVVAAPNLASSNLDCGRLVEGPPFLSVTVGADLAGVRAVHGFVDVDVESVSARGHDGRTYDTQVIPGVLAGSDSGLFVILYPPGESIVAITAYGANGAVLEGRKVE